MYEAIRDAVLDAWHADILSDIGAAQALHDLDKVFELGADWEQQSVAQAPLN